jgi:hypothetical protein
VDQLADAFGEELLVGWLYPKPTGDLPAPTAPPLGKGLVRPQRPSKKTEFLFLATTRI